MSAVAHASRSRAAFVLYLLLWAWMVGLSALVLVNFRVAGDLAGQSQVDSALAFYPVSRPYLGFHIRRLKMSRLCALCRIWPFLSPPAPNIMPRW